MSRQERQPTTSESQRQLLREVTHDPKIARERQSRVNALYVDADAEDTKASDKAVAAVERVSAAAGKLTGAQIRLSKAQQKERYLLFRISAEVEERAKLSGLIDAARVDQSDALFERSARNAAGKVLSFQQARVEVDERLAALQQELDNVQLQIAHLEATLVETNHNIGAYRGVAQHRIDIAVDDARFLRAARVARRETDVAALTWRGESDDESNDDDDGDAVCWNAADNNNMGAAAPLPAFPNAVLYPAPLCEPRHE